MSTYIAAYYVSGKHILMVHIRTYVICDILLSRLFSDSCISGVRDALSYVRQELFVIDS
jgi:hypothetical protein